jgi:ATP-dependent protease ClpP protease subunit
MVVGALLTSGSSLASVLVMVSTYRLRESADSSTYLLCQMQDSTTGATIPVGFMDIRIRGWCETPHAR